MQILGHADLHSLASPDMPLVLTCPHAAERLIRQLYARELHQNCGH